MISQQISEAIVFKFSDDILSTDIVSSNPKTESTTLGNLENLNNLE